MLPNLVLRYADGVLPGQGSPDHTEESMSTLSYTGTTAASGSLQSKRLVGRGYFNNCIMPNILQTNFFSWLNKQTMIPFILSPGPKNEKEFVLRL